MPSSILAIFLFLFCNFTMLQKVGKKPSLKQTEQLEFNSVTNMVAKIDINALKINKKKNQEQMSLKRGKKLKTTSLNSK